MNNRIKLRYLDKNRNLVEENIRIVNGKILYSDSNDEFITIGPEILSHIFVNPDNVECTNETAKLVLIFLERFGEIQILSDINKKELLKLQRVCIHKWGEINCLAINDYIPYREKEKIKKVCGSIKNPYINLGNFGAVGDINDTEAPIVLYYMYQPPEILNTPSGWINSKKHKPIKTQMAKIYTIGYRDNPFKKETISGTLTELYEYINPRIYSDIFTKEVNDIEIKSLFGLLYLQALNEIEIYNDLRYYQYSSNSRRQLIYCISNLVECIRLVDIEPLIDSISNACYKKLIDYTKSRALVYPTHLNLTNSGVVAPIINNSNKSKEMKKNSMFSSIIEKYKATMIPTKDLNLKMSMTGEICAPLKDGEYVTATKAGDLISYPSEMLLDFPVYTINKTVAQVAVGDIILVNNTYSRVTNIDKGKIRSISFTSGNNRQTRAIKDFFSGLQTVKVVFNMLTGLGAGGLNPMMLMMALKDENGSKMEMKDMMLMNMLSQSQSGNTAVGDNGMMNSFLMMSMFDNDSDNSDMMQMMMMQSMMGNQQGTQNPMANMMPLMLMGKSGGNSDMFEMMMMSQMMGQNQTGNMFGNMFQPQVPVQQVIVSTDTEDESAE